MLRLGHRGACGYAPENTLASMQKAIELGCDGVEFDIQLSRDGIPAVIHDDTLERTTNGTGKVCDYDFVELQKFDAGNGEKIPSLAELIDFIDKRCSLYIELKAENSVTPVAEAIRNAIDNKGWSEEKFFVLSFNHAQIVEMKKLLPEIRTCALFVGIPTSLAQIAEDAGAWSINTAIHHTNQSLVDDAHARGMKVLPWTANTRAEIKLARELGADGIFSNFPDRI